MGPFSNVKFGYHADGWYKKAMAFLKWPTFGALLPYSFSRWDTEVVPVTFMWQWQCNYAWSRQNNL